MGKEQLLIFNILKWFLYPIWWWHEKLLIQCGTGQNMFKGLDARAGLWLKEFRKQAPIWLNTWLWITDDRDSLHCVNGRLRENQTQKNCERSHRTFIEELAPNHTDKHWNIKCKDMSLIFEIGKALMKKQGTRNPEGYLKRRIGMAIY